MWPSVAVSAHASDVLGSAEAAGPPRLVARRRPRVLVVDGAAANRELLEGCLRELGYDVRHAGDGVEALEAVRADEPDLVLLDVSLPRLDGVAVCRAMKSHPTRRLIPVVLVTAAQDRGARLRGLEAGADDFLAKPVDGQELRVRARVLLRDRELGRRLDASENVVLALARAIEARDRYTIHHAERVGQYSRSIGQAYGLPAEDLDVLYQGAVLHDVGKAVIPSEILLKRSPLTDEEYAVMTSHSSKGEEICMPFRSTTYCLPIIRHHHERWDGGGYPDHLSGTAIPLGARIVAVPDAWDAMTSDRPYRPALLREEAIRRLRAGAGSQWDPAFVEIFSALAGQGLVDRVNASYLADPLS